MAITIVLEHTSHPGNIGACARAMYTMGFNDLILINPCEINEEALLRARNGHEILTNAKIADNLDILDQFHAIFGTTSRHRSLNLPVYSSNSISDTILQDSKKDTAILFGNEKNGLSNALLQTCQGVIEIPAEPGCSLNLSHALQVICYELRRKTALPIEKSATTLKDRKHFIKWIEDYYSGSGFLLPHTLNRIQNIINKANLTEEELKLMYSLISSKPEK